MLAKTTTARMIPKTTNIPIRVTSVVVNTRE